MGEGRRADRFGREFRVLAISEGVSTLGDQLALVAVAVRVFDTTGSAAAAALTLAATFLPDLVAGPLLAPLVDRRPRRTVMAVCAALQAVCAAALAIPGMPVPVVLACVVAIAMVAAPYKAAQGVTAREVVPEGPARDKVQAVMTTIREVGQLAGLAASAVAVAYIGTTAALLINAGTYVVVAVLVRLGLTRQPPVAAAARDARRGFGLVWNNPRLRAATLVILVGTVAILPEAVIVPLTHEMHAPSWMAGLFLAADVVGILVGTTALTLRRVDHQVRVALVGPMLVCAVAPLLVFATHPGPIVVVVAMFASGVGAAYLPTVVTVALNLAPEGTSGRVWGWMRTGLRAGQGVGILAGGLLADLLGSPSTAVAVIGVLGSLAAVACAAAWARTISRAPSGAAA
ncbi:hypothetical protein [Alloactinosynnema sp. L-07]|uniref:MFS transporter n=1 Tax=Alloactinosynnema sp. L-07 TaxID=1653480 RepID=UPI00065EFAF6|nr:MFS transporter [Alloactinosynnema sp. L-07]CRK57021.1 hypothetical protein [Alloactinosynnema sp. L-07]